MTFKELPLWLRVFLRGMGILLTAIILVATGLGLLAILHVIFGKIGIPVFLVILVLAFIFFAAWAMEL